MTQQINLLRPKDRSFGAAVGAGASIGLALIVFAVYYQSVWSETRRLRAVVEVKADALVKLRSDVDKLQADKKKQGDATALTAEIAAMRPQAVVFGALVKDVQGGGLGSAEGFARYYQTLGSISENGLWITSIDVSKGGTAVTLNGRALRNDAVMQYARRLNDAFTPHNVRFNSLELTPEALSKPGAPAPTVTAIAFKLS